MIQRLRKPAMIPHHEPAGVVHFTSGWWAGRLRSACQQAGTITTFVEEVSCSVCAGIISSQGLKGRRGLSRKPRFLVNDSASRCPICGRVFVHNQPIEEGTLYITCACWYEGHELTTDPDRVYRELAQ